MAYLFGIAMCQEVKHFSDFREYNIFECLKLLIRFDIWNGKAVAHNQICAQAIHLIVNFVESITHLRYVLRFVVGALRFYTVRDKEQEYVVML